MRIGLYPGCSLEGSAREYAESLRAIALVLGWELDELQEWNCCGATAAHCLDPTLARALPARNLALAEQAELDELLVPCSACYSRLGATRQELLGNESLRRSIGEVIEMDVTGRTRVAHVLEVLARAAADGLAAKVARPFKHRVACYYGCYLTRPGTIAVCGQKEDPQEMDELMRIIGAEPIDWAFKVECCGAGLSLTRVDLVGELSGRIVEDALHRGAEAIIVACPMCHSNLDLRRPAIEKRLGRKTSIPVLYVTQAIGLALGLEPRSLGLHRHMVRVRWDEQSEAVGAAAPPVPAACAAAEH